MMGYNPELLPRVDSPTLRKAVEGFPCTLRISSFIPGHSCSGKDTVVGCHMATIGKGMGLKSSDLFIAAGCFNCHNLLDARDGRWHWVLEHYPIAAMGRIMRGVHETQSMLEDAGIIRVKGNLNRINRKTK